MPARWRFGAGTIAVSVGVTLVALLSTAAPTEGAGPPVATYMGDEVCSACHGDLIPAWRATIHAKAFAHPYAHEDVMSRGCEGCHGPGSLHVEAGGGRGSGGLVTFASDDEPTVRSENAVCLECHSGGRRLYWEGSPHHSSDVSCASCHRIMGSTAEDVDTCARCHTLQNAQRFRNAHMPLREGKMSCSSCRSSGSTRPSWRAASTVTCRTARRGRACSGTTLPASARSVTPPVTPRTRVIPRTGSRSEAPA